jgi:hypothetical protein
VQPAHRHATPMWSIGSQVMTLAAPLMVCHCHIQLVPATRCAQQEPRDCRVSCDVYPAAWAGSVSTVLLLDRAARVDTRGAVHRGDSWSLVMVCRSANAKCKTGSDAGWAPRRAPPYHVRRW